MFLAGKKSSVLKSDTSKEVICPKCNSKNSTKVSIIGTYKHLLHIPFLSAGKSGTSNCTKCETKFSLNNTTHFKCLILYASTNTKYYRKMTNGIPILQRKIPGYSFRR